MNATIVMFLIAASTPEAQGPAPGEALHAVVRASFQGLKDRMVARLREAESKSAAVSRHAADVERASKKVAALKVAVDIAESRVQEYSEAVYKQAVAEIDAKIVAVEIELKAIEARAKLVRSFNTAPGAQVDSTVRAHNVNLAWYKAEKHALDEYAKPLRIRELVAKVDDAKAESDAASALLAVDRAELETERREALAFAITEGEKEAMRLFLPIGADWAKLAARRREMAPTEAELSLLRDRIREAEERWTRAQEAREAQQDAAAIEAIRAATSNKEIGETATPATP